MRVNSFVGLSADLRQRLINHALNFFNRPLGYTFTPNENLVLTSFFTNLDGHIFLMFGLTPNLMATLSAMYSRLNNPRGLRGIFVDTFLPGFLASFFYEVATEPFNGNVEKFLSDHDIRSLDKFINYSEEAAGLYQWFVKEICNDPKAIRHFASSKKARRFLKTWLDKFGHNSIGRMGSMMICAEGVSILAAKSLEWNRPGSGFVELSTRYVNMEASGLYPIAEELALLGLPAAHITLYLEWLFDQYRMLQGEKGDGPFSSFLAKHYGDQIDARGIAGETADVLGNLLPNAALTSLAVHVTGEAFTALIKHLHLDQTAENEALATLICEEASAIGGDQFSRYLEPSDFERNCWTYLSPHRFVAMSTSITPIGIFDRQIVESVLLEAFRYVYAVEDATMEDIASLLDIHKRGDFDKLPCQFEHYSMAFAASMSFRSWRDTERMGLSTHGRTLVTPDIGFYRFNKPHPPELEISFGEAQRKGTELYRMLQQFVPPTMLQYILPMGFLVGFTYSANLRQHEFANWQRTKYDVNHEVRQFFLAVEFLLRDTLPWWPLFSRANTTPAYISARGPKISL